MLKKNKKEDLKIHIKILNHLIKNKKIVFKFYNNNLLNLDLIEICITEKKKKLSYNFVM